MRQIVLAVGVFFLYAFVVIGSYSVLYQPVVDTINSFNSSVNMSQVYFSRDLLVVVWHMVPVVLLGLDVVWLLFWVHRREYEEYYE